MKRVFLLAPLIVFMCLSCNKKESICLDYDSFQNRFIEWKEILNQKENDYYTYIFSYTCGHCKEIKDDILSYAHNNENVYFVVFNEEVKVIDSRVNIIGEDDIDKIGIVGTPTLFEIKEYKIKENFIGSMKIIEHIKNKT